MYCIPLHGDAEIYAKWSYYKKRVANLVYNPCSNFIPITCYGVCPRQHQTGPDRPQSGLDSCSVGGPTRAPDSPRWPQTVQDCSRHPQTGVWFLLKTTDLLVHSGTELAKDSDYSWNENLAKLLSIHVGSMRSTVGYSLWCNLGWSSLDLWPLGVNMEKIKAAVQSVSLICLSWIRTVGIYVVTDLTVSEDKQCSLKWENEISGWKINQWPMICIHSDTTVRH